MFYLCLIFSVGWNKIEKDNELSNKIKAFFVIIKQIFHVTENL
jgi:hypothetical protein